MATRREFLRNAGLLGAGTVLLSGCSSYVTAGITGGRAGQGEIDYWNLFGGGDGKRMRAMVAAFEQQHPGTDVKPITLTWGSPYYTKLSLATLGDQPPDIGISHLSRMPALARAGLLQKLTGSERAPHGLIAERFSSRPWEKAHVDGDLYAVPLDTHPFVLFYNTKFCEKAGLLDSGGDLKPIEGTADFARALRKVKDAGAQWGGILVTIDDPASSWRLFWTLYTQAGGGDILADQGDTVALDEDVAERVIGYMRELSVEKDLMPRSIDYPGGVAMFAEGKAGFFLQGEWEITTFATAGTPFSMARFPQLYPERYAIQADSHSFVIPAWPEADEQRLDRVQTFLRGMLDESLTWAKGGHIPAWLPVRNSDTYRALDPQSKYADSVQHAVYDPQAWYSGSGSNFEQVIGSAVAAAVAGRIDPRTAVHRLRDRVRDLANTPSPIV